MEETNTVPTPEESNTASTTPPQPEPAAPPQPVPASDALPAEGPAPAPRKKPAAFTDPYFWGTGRRKTSVARVRIKPGEGKFIVNEKDVDVYFCVENHRRTVRAPLTATDAMKSYDVVVNVSGGGITGQAGAVSLGLARALTKADAAHEPKLRDRDLLTRDPREVERKKYGQSGARRRFQFSKR